MTRQTEARAAKTTGDPRWRAILDRDPAADGRFFYSVRTTGVYCRPSCGARTPRPEHVDFHATAEAARQAGFRPCRRCQPDQPPLTERHAALVAGVCRRIEQADSVPGLAELARSAGVSAFHLHRIFKTVTGVTPRAYATALRARKLRDQLGRGASVSDAIYEAGYQSSGRFYAESDRLLGMTPKRYRAGGANMPIRFAVGECALGAILVAAGERGICAISLGDDPDALIRDLQDRFPKAELVGGDAEFEQWVARVVGFVDSPRQGLDLPLDIRGTAFQQRVWQALRELPPGTTASYAEIARRIGAPRSARGVAQACAANVLAVAIPCHRVIRTDGGLAGYRWGIERKRALLDRESTP
jgi:AraC family transcriptional regulator of adaptative response/methylated-DNA-[protein]-cysteine methyltransferase